MALIDDIQEVIRVEVGEPLQALHEELIQLDERIGVMEKTIADQITQSGKQGEAKSAERLDLSDQRWSERVELLKEKLGVGIKHADEGVASAKNELSAEVRGLRGEFQSELKRTQDAVNHAGDGLSTEIRRLDESIAGRLESLLNEIRSEWKRACDAIGHFQSEIASRFDGSEEGVRAEFRRLDTVVQNLKEQLLNEQQVRERLVRLEAAIEELHRKPPSILKKDHSKPAENPQSSKAAISTSKPAHKGRK